MAESSRNSDFKTKMDTMMAQMAIYRNKIKELEAENSAMRQENMELRGKTEALSTITTSQGLGRSTTHSGVGHLDPMPLHIPGSKFFYPSTTYQGPLNHIMEPDRGRFDKVTRTHGERVAPPPDNQSVPRVPAPIRRSTNNNFVVSPFVNAIALVQMPPKFCFPNMKL